MSLLKALQPNHNRPSLFEGRIVVKRPDPSSLASAAIEEAAHAIMAMELCEPILSIFVNRDEGGGGMIFRRLSFEICPRHRAMIAAAGSIGERLFGDGCGCYPSGDDRRVYDKAISEMKLSRE